MKLLHSTESRRSQRGASLMMVLTLLLATSMLGVAGLGSTLLGERMSANLYDRSLAFQSAESALRSAQEHIQTMARSGAAIGFDCSNPNAGCEVLPDNTYVGNRPGCAGYAQNCWITDNTAQQALQAEHPQYYIQYLGDRQGADQKAIGAAPGSDSGARGDTFESVYRVFARSHDPDSGTGRSLVVLTSGVVVRKSSPVAAPEVRRVLWRELVRE